MYINFIQVNLQHKTFLLTELFSLIFTVKYWLTSLSQLLCPVAAGYSQYSILVYEIVKAD